jgi:predicted negative regulator of RcsB-dependent stress response
MAEEYLTDDEQLEQVKRVVQENWVWVAGGIVLGAALFFGYRYYDGHRNEVALRAAARFDDMTAALEVNDVAKSRQIADSLIKDFPASPYADQAQLLIARLAVDGGQLAGAVGPLTQVMTGSKDSELKHIARMRLARVLIAMGKPDDAVKTLADDPAPGPFATRYHQVRGDAFYAKNDFKDAMAEYKAALAGGDLGNGDSQVLQLKIADLAAPAAPAAASVPVPAVPASGDPSNKAKP